MGRIENTQSLIHKGLIPPILGLPNFPHRDTLSTFMWRFTPEALESLGTAQDRLRSSFFQRFDLLYSAIVDADTTTMMAYGQQEGVAVGYVPKRRHGKPSYAPILSIEGRCGMSLGGQLRSGNVHSSTDAVEFLVPILEKLPTSIAAPRTSVRLDGGFYSGEITQSLDEKKIGYVIVALMTGPLKQRMLAARYHDFAEGWQAGEFTYTPFHWDKRHRFVAIRRPRGYEPEDIQRRLFTFKRYTYHRVLVTSLEMTPEGIYRFYCDRAFQELLIREFKDS